jgi:actin-like ATPase involved in cell morphogenesis
VFQRDATNSLHLLFVVHLGIDLGSGNVLMTKHMLHHMERCSVVELQASVGVSASVNRHVCRWAK